MLPKNVMFQIARSVQIRENWQKRQKKAGTASTTSTICNIAYGTYSTACDKDP